MVAGKVLKTRPLSAHLQKNIIPRVHTKNECGKWQKQAPISWPSVFWLTLSGLGLISLLTGHFYSEVERYPHRFLRGSLNTKPDRRRHAPVDIWKSRYSKLYHGCSSRSPHFSGAVPEQLSNGYLLIATNGGLNQQRSGIIDAVVVTHILNATLVVPELDHRSFWRDDSDFVNIFDVDWFISSLADDVTIVKRVPDNVMRSMERPPYTMRVPRKSPPQYYLDEVLPTLMRRRVVQLTKFDYRLADSIDDEELQKLRCRVNYHGLRFTAPIRHFAHQLVSRMRSAARRYITIHLRYEPDMLAFSGCYYGGGDKERNEFAEIRKSWPTLPERDPERERRRGKCPLTPHEVGLMLKALGFGNDTHVYIASGVIYGGEGSMQPLREMFPHLHTKEMLADAEAIAPLLSHSSQLAAVDYIVCDESDVLVTNNNGNMARILAGRRRYMGHKRTIRPNSKKLSSLLMDREQMGWDAFVDAVKYHQRRFMGDPHDITPGRGQFHEFPSSCLCTARSNRSSHF